MLHRNDKFLQLRIKIQNPTVNLTALCNSCVKVATCSSGLTFTFHYSGSRIRNASEKFFSCIYPSIVNFTLPPTPQTKRYRSYFCTFKRLYRGSHLQLDTCSYVLFFLTKTDTSSSSIGTTAHCGLRHVEQCPSIFSYLPPTLSISSLPAHEDLFLLSLSILSWVFHFFSSLPVLE